MTDEQVVTPGAGSSRAPWITAGVAGVVMIALLVVYLVALRPDQGKVNGDLSASEAAAVNAAATEMTNLLTFRRTHFDADFKRALDGATGGLKSDVSKQKANTLTAMTKGKFDLSASVTHKALEGPAESGKKNSYVVLVTLNGYQSTQKDVPTPQDLEVTVVRTGAKWLASDVTNIGVTS